ncbi:MAG: cell division protein FtsW [Deltaproteobacteria bacterium]|nr:cell division protein FtsW [Deltaproteobacteria bacterium]MBW2360145.1 cell division protein FtsW [Deltaproteobacteria bacterium]
MRRGHSAAANGHARTRRAAPAETPAASALDGSVVAAAAALAAIGVVMIYSTTAPLTMGNPLPPHFVRHLAALSAGTLLVAIALRTPLSFWRWSALPLWALGIVLLIATLVFGIEANGARRWLPLPGLPGSLQAAEIARFATLLAVTSMLARARPDSDRTLLRCIALMALPAGLLALQPDFGSAALLALLVGSLLFVAGARMTRLCALAAGGIGVLTVYSATHPYALARWKGFLAPWENARAEGFQLVQSFVAFGRGGTLGVGLGDGRQKLSYLPEAHTDFILSVVAEELGLVGVLIVLGAFAALALAGLRIARRAEDPFAQLLAFAMTAFLVIPAAVNAGVVMGCLPTTGFTLPFISFGSNSLAVCALALGVLLRIAAVEAAHPARGRQKRHAPQRGRAR